MEPFLIATLTAVMVLAIGGGYLMLRRDRSEARKVRDRAHGKRVSDDRESTDAARLATTIHRIGEKVSAGGTSSALKQQLANAGYHSGSAATVFLGVKFVLLVVGLVGGGVFAFFGETSLGAGALSVIGSGVLLFFLPNFVVKRRLNKRREEIRRRLPDSVDMLEICVTSGMGLDQAWNAVAEEIRRVSSIIADEMELTNLEVSLGTPRAEAMRHMAERTGSEDLDSLVALIVQAERFGASIVEALKTYAKTMREIRSQRAEEAAEKTAVRLLLPMVAFIFPAVLVVMVGPAVIKMMVVFNG